MSNRRALEIQDSIRQVLYHDWDPIGVAGDAPEDEYDSYIGEVYEILSGSRSDDELIDYLRRSAAERMGLSVVMPVERLRSVAK
jgi:hypothetical protein